VAAAEVLNGSARAVKQKTMPRSAKAWGRDLRIGRIGGPCHLLSLDTHRSWSRQRVLQSGATASGYDVAFCSAQDTLSAVGRHGDSWGSISWAGAVPILTSLQSAPRRRFRHASIWRHQVRFIGAGTIAISAI
jgi:hypothetical protein